MQERNADNINTLADKIESRLCDRSPDLDELCPLVAASGEARGELPPSLAEFYNDMAAAACEVAADAIIGQRDAAAPAPADSANDRVVKALFDRYFSTETLERAAPTLLIDAYLVAKYALVEHMARFLVASDEARATAAAARDAPDADVCGDGGADVETITAATGGIAL